MRISQPRRARPEAGRFAAREPIVGFIGPGKRSVMRIWARPARGKTRRVPVKWGDETSSAYHPPGDLVGRTGAGAAGASGSAGEARGAAPAPRAEGRRQPLR